MDQTMPAPDVSPDTSDKWLLEEEHRLLEERRRQAGRPAPSAEPVVALALSGGGVRSATFCLGLVRGLAYNGLLPRIDYLSTVSGGGYVGAVLGRLVMALGIDGAQEQLKRSDSMTLTWLRRYGRYLAPKGARDYGMAVATYLRAAAAIHLEIGLLALLVGAVIVLPHALQHAWYVFDAELWRGWPSVWLPLALVAWLLTGPGAMLLYWTMRDDSAGVTRPVKSALRWQDAALVLGVMFALAFIAFAPSSLLPGIAGLDTPPLQDSFVRPLGAADVRLIAAILLIGLILRTIQLWYLLLPRDRGLDVPLRHAQARQHLTKSLRLANLVAAIMFAAGAIDLLTWEFKNWLENGISWLFGGLGLGGLLVVFARSFIEPLQKLSAPTDRTGSFSAGAALGFVGLVVALALLAAWTTFVQWMVFGNSISYAPSGPNEALTRALWLAAVPILWFLLTSPNTSTVNNSSLHNFYRARLTRAYLGTGNTRRFGPDLDSGAKSACPEDISDITEVVPGDDVPLAEYQPESRGGPIHLINVCLNQTRSERSHLYNADRKGLRMTVSARGMEIGQRVVARSTESALGTLGRWTAISGAAASPGAGSYTSRGWALMLLLVGARLGYWFRPAPHPMPPVPGTSSRIDRTRQRLGETKLGLLASEALARFVGPNRSLWYLSDGGHFDNTGVHALLPREPDFIVLADCGADPRFELADLENLIRKARTDYDAEIEFYTRDRANALFTLPDSQMCVLSPEELASNYTARGVLMARICYRCSDPEPHRTGTLLIVKPNLHESLDADLLAYARRNRTFPQQPTSDQFFDEAQWESYHRLGQDFGRALTPTWLAQIPGWTSPIAEAEHLVRLRPAVPLHDLPKDDRTGPHWRPEMKAAAVGATVGLGALGALALPLWQVANHLAERRAEAEAAAQQRLQAVRASAVPWMREARRPTQQELRNLDVRSQDLLASLFVASRQQAPNSPPALFVGRVQDACDFRTDHIDVACPVGGQPPEACLAVCDRQSRDSDKGYWLTPRILSGAPTGAEVIPVDPPLSQATPPAPTLPPPDQAEQQIAAVRQPVGASAPRAIPPEAAIAPAATSLASCKGVVLYVQTYDEATRELASKLAWSQTHMQVPDVENVVRTAQAKQVPAPVPWEKPTLIVHRFGENETCARAIMNWLQMQPPLQWRYPDEWQFRPLPSSFGGKENIMELWLPTPEPSRFASLPPAT